MMETIEATKKRKTLLCHNSHFVSSKHASDISQFELNISRNCEKKNHNFPFLFLSIRQNFETFETV